MSKNWPKDIAAMHEKFEVNDHVRNLSPEMLKALLELRVNVLTEEMLELQEAVDSNHSEEVVDALIDLCVVAIGTLDAFDVDAHKAWNAVHRANMRKEPGVKESRPNPFGLPDLIKPKGWRGPSHKKNHGLLEKVK